MLRFAATVRANAFHYVSTAYVVGDADGHLPERPFGAAASNNVYEETKLAAEELVLGEAVPGLRVTILRPSVVVGHSVTSAVSGGLTGLYGLGRQLAWYAGNQRPVDPVRLSLNPRDTVNFVPVDQVAREAVSCGLYGSDRRIYHLTGRQPIRVDTLVRTLCRELGMPDPLFVSDPADLRDPERKLARRLSYYATYMRGDKRFVRANTDEVMRAATPRDVDDAMLSQLCAWYAAESRRSVAAQAPVPPAVAVSSPPATQIVLVGGGYTSLLTYRALRWRVRRELAAGSVRISIVAPGGVHRFHGWSGDILSGVLTPVNYETDFTDICSDVEVIDGIVTAVDLSGRTVTVRVVDRAEGSSATRSTTTLSYDHLVLGSGSVDREVVPGLSQNALSPKEPAQVAELRRRVRALADESGAGTRPIVVIGGGLAGVEICAGVAESFVRAKVQTPPTVVLIHSGAEILPELRPRFRRLARYAHDRLVEYGVHIRTGVRVEKVLVNDVVLVDGTTIPAELIIAAIGQYPVHILGTEEVERSADGRIRTDGYLRVLGQRGVWAGGDVAAVPHLVTGAMCPPNALWAIKHGSFIGRNVARTLRGRRPLRFSYLGLGRAGSLGVGKGILHLFGIQFTGWLAWVLRAMLFLRFMPSRRRAVGVVREFFGLLSR